MAVELLVMALHSLGVVLRVVAGLSALMTCKPLTTKKGKGTALNCYDGEFLLCYGRDNTYSDDPGHCLRLQGFQRRYGKCCLYNIFRSGWVHQAFGMLGGTLDVIRGNNDGPQGGHDRNEQRGSTGKAIMKGVREVVKRVRTIRVVMLSKVVVGKVRTNKMPQPETLNQSEVAAKGVKVA
ncbi:hypothetical protein BGZ60DRAFT_430317 [Tricladium varicosporioides]|nr:hypothetical protein BGZ60DRAFT_430317 [Hymenoscyphus varicosporioides]